MLSFEEANILKTLVNTAGHGLGRTKEHRAIHDYIDSIVEGELVCCGDESDCGGCVLEDGSREDLIRNSFDEEEF